MDIRKCIESQTRNNEDQKLNSKPKFQKVKKEKPTKSPRVRGERPLLDITDISNNIDSANSGKNSKPRKAKKMQTLQQPISSQTTNYSSESFAAIIPSVREVTGGCNTQSNEVIERRHRERQRQFLEGSGKAGSTCSLNATDTTLSSETTDSYKTAVEDSFNSRSLDQRQNTSTVIKDNSLERYKKNALIKGLLQDAANNCPDKDESSTECSSDFMDASASINDIQGDMEHLNIGGSEGDNMSKELIFRLLQSREDEDLYVHPIREVHNDPEWQRRRLARQGIETTQTPRHYFMNLEDDGFAFSAKK